MRFKHSLITLFCFVLLVLFSVFAFAGTWSSLGPPTNSSCSQNFHVMCSENSSLLSEYDPATGLIPYSNSLSGGTNEFCAITNNSGSIEFGFISDASITTFSDLKRSSLLVEENRFAVNYGAGDGFFDENCNADEIFPRSANQSLDLTKYIENNITYDVEYTPSNVDDFDIIALDSSDNLLMHGTALYGTILDRNTNSPVPNVNVTLYFKNQQGSLIPYLSYLSDSSGEFDTIAPRTIETYFDTYVDVSLIPKTTYIIITQHPLYEDLVQEVDLRTSSLVENFYITPFGVCESDCTFEGSNLCRQECQGINSCAFGTINGNWEVVAQRMHLQLKDSTGYFGVNGSYYEAVACTGMPVEIDSLPQTSGGTTCPEDKSTWKTEWLVNLGGESAKLVLTNCQ